jgi:hypothetical protein
MTATAATEITENSEAARILAELRAELSAA